MKLSFYLFSKLLIKRPHCVVPRNIHTTPMSVVGTSEGLFGGGGKGGGWEGSKVKKYIKGKNKA